MGLDIYVHSLVYNSAQLGMTKSCNLGKILVVPSFVARHFQVRLDARAPSGECWNYLLRRLSCNVEDLTPSTPFSYLILTTNLWQGATDSISLRVFKAWVATNHIKRVMMFAHQITCAAFHFVIWIASTAKFVYKSTTYTYICRNWTPIITWANSMKRFMKFDK